MAAARQRRTIDVDGVQLILLKDLSRHTLALRRAMKPLFVILQEKNILYKWRVPFQLQVHHKVQMAIFRDIEDLPGFLKSLQLPEIELPQ